MHESISHSFRLKRNFISPETQSPLILIKQYAAKLLPLFQADMNRLNWIYAECAAAVVATTDSLNRCFLFDMISGMISSNMSPVIQTLSRVSSPLFFSYRECFAFIFLHSCPWPFQGLYEICKTTFLCLLLAYRDRTQQQSALRHPKRAKIQLSHHGHWE